MLQMTAAESSFGGGDNAKRLLFAVTEVLLLNRHIRHLKLFCFGEGDPKFCHRVLCHSYRRRNTLGQLQCSPLSGFTTFQSTSELNLVKRICKFADPSGREV